MGGLMRCPNCKRTGMVKRDQFRTRTGQVVRYVQCQNCRWIRYDNDKQKADR